MQGKVAEPAGIVLFQMLLELLLHQLILKLGRSDLPLQLLQLPGQGYVGVVDLFHLTVQLPS